jgi:GAF domain-containing protein
MADRELLIHAVSEFARTLARGAVSSDVLDDLAVRVTAVLAVADAGVSVLVSGQFRFAAASDERSAGLERVQEAGQAGPGVDACLTGKIVTVAELTGTPREWGQYQQAVRDAGIAAVASVPMRHDGQGIGAVDLYSDSRRDWSADDLDVAVILADMATGYLVQARELDRQRRVNEQLQHALDSRIVIEQAKGVLAAERHIPVDEAFEVLRRHARSHAVSLRSVAEAVVNLGLRP